MEHNSLTLFGVAIALYFVAMPLYFIAAGWGKPQIARAAMAVTARIFAITGMMLVVVVPLPSEP